jgi:hypothetical protein
MVAFRNSFFYYLPAKMESFFMKTTTIKKVSKPKIRRVGVAGFKKELADLEKKYKMTTETFLQKVQSGEMEDTHDIVRWLGTAETYHAIYEE